MPGRRDTAHRRTTAAAVVRAPLSHLRWAVGLAATYAGIALVQLILPGPAQRWMAVHLFTLGVLTNLVAALAHHFGQTLLRAPDQPRSAGKRLLLLNVGVLLVLASHLRGRTLLVSGAVVTTAAVVWLWWDLRRMRRASVSAGRFDFVVRGYERAAGAFIHGALLGALLGVGALRGPWYMSGRLAHLHVQLLGWAGMTLLATLVFFGPTVLRRRIAPGAERLAARALRAGGIGLSVGVLALLASAAPGMLGGGLRLVAAFGLAVYALGVTSVCGPILRSGSAADSSLPAGGMHLLAACVWFTTLVWADVLAVAIGRWDWLDALGVMFLVGVLVQSLMGALSALVPMVWGVGPEMRNAVRERLETFAVPRLLVVNAAAIAAGAAGVGSLPAAVAMSLLAVAVLGQILIAIWSLLP